MWENVKFWLARVIADLIGLAVIFGVFCLIVLIVFGGAWAHEKFVNWRRKGR